ncbi:Autophagy protein 7 [Tulasnella sp. 424]|nr:Autophagy protein 7 [Tulasnella sp. 424]KAG8974807.1 Autophagy protein 7 [Tulasnella sp. 425]
MANQGSTKPLLQFTPFSSTVQPAFWNELTNLKIDVLRLSQDAIPIHASYSIGRAVVDRETGMEVALGCNLVVSGDAFKDPKDVKPPPNSVTVRGLLKNFNTIEEFKNVNKQEMFNNTAKEMWAKTLQTGDPLHLFDFLLITFADLKKYKYYYWFAFPAFAASPPWEKEGECAPVVDVIPIKGLESIHKAIHSGGSDSSIAAAVLAKPSANDPTAYETAPLNKFSEFFAGTPNEKRFVVFSDPSAHAQHVGWPLRNILTYILFNHHQTASIGLSSPLNIIAWRDIDTPSSSSPPKSIYVKAYVPSLPDTSSVPAAVGWEKNPAGKLGPRMADLAPMMDPKRLADQAVDLNLKLMRWRILPGLDLEKVSGTRCLLLGAGTLGCYVARTLMGWGVRKITFVDSGKVSFSNPVRQPLFEFEDCLEGGKPKAATAAERLKKIFPGVDATGHEFLIPMPGHPIPPQSLEQTKKDVAKLEQLVNDHDVMFLLMDSRESRWLPTVLGAAKGKIVINCALGFDSYLVMRHGARESITPQGSTRLGCYYCNDIVAPADSLKDQTLDQMCTVTRPGLASIASSTAVELLVSLLQHPKGIHAPSPPMPGSGAQVVDTHSEEYNSVLGLVPHQMRGYLARFNTMLITGAAFGSCTGCSETVIKAYESEGFPMLLKAFNEVGYLEKLTGLDKLHSEGEAALEAVDWDEDDDDM